MANRRLFGAQGLLRRPWRMWLRHPRAVAYAFVPVFIVGLAVGAARAGFPDGVGSNLLLNSAGDLIGALVLLTLIEPIVARAATHLRQHRQLDFADFVGRAGQARERIRILDTSTKMFEVPKAGATLLGALKAGASVQVLLMMPHSANSDLRRHQLYPIEKDIELNREIYENIQALSRVEQDLERAREDDPSVRGSLELRLYEAAAPFTLYAHDERMLFSLMPVANYTFKAVQLELPASSDLGLRIADDFTELWNSAIPVTQRMKVWIGSEPQARESQYVLHRRAIYLTSRDIVAALDSLAPEDRVVSVADEAGDQRGGQFRLDKVAADGQLYGDLVEAYTAKYSNRTHNLQFYLLSEGSAQRVQTALIGHVAVREALPIPGVLNALRVANRSVRFLDTASTLVGFDDERSAEFVAAASEAVRRGAIVRILLMEPTGRAARERAAESGVGGDLDLQIEQNIKVLRRLADQVPREGVREESKRLQIRFFNENLDTSVHQIDDQMYVAFRNQKTRHTAELPQLEAHRSSEIGEFAVGVFDKLWERGRPLSGMQFVTVRPGPSAGERYFVRAWKHRGDWYLASHRIAELAREAELTVVVETASGDRNGAGHGSGSTLSDPLDAREHGAVWESFAALYGTATPGPEVPILRVNASVSRPEGRSKGLREPGWKEGFLRRNG